MFDGRSSTNSYLSVPMKKNCEDSFFVRAFMIEGLSLENHKADTHNIPLQWLLGANPVLNGEPIDVLQIMESRTGMIAEVRYK